ncbi:MAG: hypothetical protein OEZ01_08325 [Candidatus Heimdallarchaeota archaeon]|nr:hypothetical protein [Candidatus Heimdallarchaeota archaeon]MDH5645999.1 hypothetical protein [Candidatus Heimdallarchaeota archaeon]
MSQSIKISKEKKQELEEIQTRLIKDCGKKIDLQSLLDLTIEISKNNYDELLKLILRVNTPKPNYKSADHLLENFWKIADMTLDQEKSDDELIYDT